jgi:hypothetical protein
MPGISKPNSTPAVRRVKPDLHHLTCCIFKELAKRVKAEVKVLKNDLHHLNLCITKGYGDGEGGEGKFIYLFPVYAPCITLYFFFLLLSFFYKEKSLHPSPLLSVVHLSGEGGRFSTFTTFTFCIKKWGLI